METKAKLGAKAIGRRELENNEGYELKEPQSPYNHVFDPKKLSLRLKNDHFLENFLIDYRSIAWSDKRYGRYGDSM